MNTKNVRGLREQLSESFINFNNIRSDYTFLSDLTMEDSFREFFLKIYHDDKRFRSIYNDSLDHFQQEYRFRYKNYPFPKLNDDDLPFWMYSDLEQHALIEIFKPYLPVLSPSSHQSCKHAISGFT